MVESVVTLPVGDKREPLNHCRSNLTMPSNLTRLDECLELGDAAPGGEDGSLAYLDEELPASLTHQCIGED